MHFTRLLFLLLLSIETPIIASAQLVERQEVWPAARNAGGLLWGTLELLKGTVDLFSGSDSGSGSDSSKPDSPTNTDNTPSNRQPSPNAPAVKPASPNAPVVEPATPSSLAVPSLDASPSTGDVYKLRIDNSQNDPLLLPGLVPSLPGVMPTVKKQCESMNAVDADCDQATEQLIFTLSCGGTDPTQAISDEARAQNEAIRKALDAMNNENILTRRGKGGQVGISTSRRCDVFFFRAALTKKQIGEIGGKPGVRFVTPNQPLHVDDYPVSSTGGYLNNEKPPVLAAPRSRFKRRSQILTDPLAYDDLRFISTAPNSEPSSAEPSSAEPSSAEPSSAELSSAYFYREEAGEGITIFAVDTAANIQHEEFKTESGESSIIFQRIYGMGSLDEPDEDDGRVKCRFSKMVGRTCGVARKAKVQIATVGSLVGSLLDVFNQIDNFLLDKVKLGEEVIGKYVMSLMVEWGLGDSRITMQLEWVFRRIVNDHQVTVIVSAGRDPSNSNSRIDTWPASIQGILDIIVVGAVNVHTGIMYPFSKAGILLTVNAPGEARCAVGSLYDIWAGPDLAAAEVTGLAAYYLSLRDITDYLRDNTYSIPWNLKHFIGRSAAKILHGGLPAIWNLLPWNPDLDPTQEVLFRRL